MSCDARAGDLPRSGFVKTNRFLRHPARHKTDPWHCADRAGMASTLS